MYTYCFAAAKASRGPVAKALAINNWPHRPQQLVRYITVCAVVQHCCKGDERFQWKMPFLSVFSLSIKLLWLLLQLHTSHCAQTAEDINTISIAYDSQMCLPDRVKIWLTSVNQFLPKFCHKVTHTPVDLSVRNIPRQIAAE